MHEGVDGELADLGPERGDLGGLRLHGGGGVGEGLLGFGGGALGLGEEGLLAGHVRLEGVKGGGHLRVGGLQRVHLRGDLGRLRPDPLPFGRGVAGLPLGGVDHRGRHERQRQDDADRRDGGSQGQLREAHEPHRGSRGRGKMRQSLPRATLATSPTGATLRELVGTPAG